LIGYYTPDGKLISAGRAGTGFRIGAVSQRPQPWRSTKCGWTSRHPGQPVRIAAGA
jgi:hypothetical protein